MRRPKAYVIVETPAPSSEVTRGMLEDLLPSGYVIQAELRGERRSAFLVRAGLAGLRTAANVAQRIEMVTPFRAREVLPQDVDVSWSSVALSVSGLRLHYRKSR